MNNGLFAGGSLSLLIGVIFLLGGTKSWGGGWLWWVLTRGDSKRAGALWFIPVALGILLVAISFAIP